MNSIIVDDEIAAIKILESYSQKVPSLNHLGSFTNPVEALNFAQNNPVDLIFLDINMPNLSGMSFLKLLEGKCKVILTSAYTDYALEGYKFGVLDYLTKPIAFYDFLKATQMADQRNKELISLNESEENDIFSEDYIMVKTDHKGKLVKVLFSEIVYIASIRNYVSIFTTSNKKIITRLSMKQLEDRLPDRYFFRTHKTYIIALSRMELIDGSIIILKDTEAQIPLGSSYRDAFFSRIQNKMITQK